MKFRPTAIRFLLPALAVVVVALWFAAFKPQPKLNFTDIVIEAIHLLAVVTGYFFVTRLRIRMLEIGWALFVLALLIDFLDKWTKEPDFYNTVVQGTLEASALILIAVGMFTSHRLLQRHAEKTEAAEREARVSEAHFRRLFENSPMPLWEEDWSNVKRWLDGLSGEAGMGLEALLAGNQNTVAFCDASFLSSELRLGDHVLVEVRDEGPGLSETLGSIFEPFFTTRFPGRGLSLSAAQGVAKAHGGAIQVETSEGRGSTFRLLLPVEAPAEKNVSGAD